ncbi:MAG: hypothetical protein GXP27_16580 [Planctomycetes bacterium]|nr:hypothetical protein [Planctomycetota bacterium]
MKISRTKPLFAWDGLEDQPTLRTIRGFSESIPDARLLAGLRARRGQGRNDDPLPVPHPVGDAAIDDGAAVADDRVVPGGTETEPVASAFDRSGEESDVPKACNMSRFLAALGQEPHRTHLRECFDRMIRRLAELLPDLGEQTVGGASGLSARRPRGLKEVEAGGSEKVVLDEDALRFAGGRRRLLGTTERWARRA